VTTLKDTAITFTGIKTFQNDVILESNLRVKGELLVANTVNMTVSDPILELGSNNQNTGDVGLVMTRHGTSNSNVAIFFDESDDILKLGYTLDGANDTALELDSNALAVSVQGALTAASMSATTFTGSMSKSLSAGNYLTGDAYNGSTDRTFNVDATSDNTGGKVVARDASGNFNANIITGNTLKLSGGGGTEIGISDDYLNYSPYTYFRNSNDNDASYFNFLHNYTIVTQSGSGPNNEIMSLRLYSISNGTTDADTRAYIPGRLGIGVSSPSYKLDVNGDINISSGNTYKIGGNDVQYLAAVNAVSVTTGDAGTDASVSLGGTSSAATLSFTIPRGADGAQGLQGLKGDRGLQGIQGIQGPKGDTGLKGDTGAAGADGAQGPQGLKGDTGADGAQGPQGPQGLKGDTGADGAQGPQGPQGPQGLKGDTGAAGADGARGPQGLKGDTGAAGADGAQGPQGLKGDTGAAGADGARGPQGLKGDTGADGPQGPQGEQGIQGIQGPQGGTDLDSDLIFNNMGGNHSNRTDFNAIPDAGCYYVTGTTNGPGVNSANQYYGFTLGLGANYTPVINQTGKYGTQIYWGRNVTNPYINIRYLENGSWGGWRKAAAGYADSAGTATNQSGGSVSATTGTFSGDLTVTGKIYNYNYTEVDINAPDTVSGTWSTGTSSNWGDPKFNNTYDRTRWNDAPGYLEYTIPTGMKSAYLSQLTWSTGGYVDIHGVQSDGGLVFLRRINTRQAVENTNEGNPDQHDGMTVTFAGTGLQHFSKIRLTNKVGRFHMSGLAFTPNGNEGTEGVGMVHSAQISDLGTGIPTRTGTGATGTWGINITGTAGTATNQSGGSVACTSGTFSGTFSASTASSRDKFRVYPSSLYCIGMQSGVTYGDLNDWSMTFQMSNENDRGFWWGDDGHGVNQGAMALSTRGWLNVAERIKVGGGQTDTGAASYPLHVVGSSYFTNTLNIQPSSTGGGQNIFTGYRTDSYGRAQLVLSSGYSDIMIASSQANNNHGSNLSFVTYNPANAADYRKFVINQGNWGSRKQFLDFGYADATRANPHDYINGTDTVFTLDGINKRVGIKSINPTHNLDVNGNAHISSSLECDGRIYADNGCHVRGDWLRVNGSNGIYFESYGGGWHMTDSTWIRAYNSKPIWVTDHIHVHQADTGVATLSAYGDSQGTGRLYVGQDGSYGGGIEYNGDNSPTSTGAGADYITLYRVNNGTYDWTARNYYSSNDWSFRGQVYAAGAFYTDANRSVIRGGSPTLYFRDTDQMSAMIHNNANLLYILRGGTDTETWSQVNGQWPWIFNLSNNDSTCGGNLYINGGNMFLGSGRGLRTVSGEYGTVQTTGGGAGNWEGYSIDGRYVFMSADNNNVGLYNDLDNEWMIYCARNAWTKLYYNGAEKLATTNTGVSVTGTVTATTFSGNATSATNADTVDNLHASSFLRSDADDTVNAGVTYSWAATNTHGLSFKNSSYNTYLYIGGWTSSNDNNISRIRNSSGNLHIDSAANGNLYLNWYTAGSVEVGSSINVNGTVTATTFSGTATYANSAGSAGSAGNVTGQSSISKAAYAVGANDYHLELFAGNSGNANTDISLRFHQGGVYWGSIRYRGSGFYFTDGASDSRKPVYTGDLNVTGSIYASGNITAYSDIRKKKNLQIIETPIEKVKKINGYTYEMDEMRYTGLVAQEVLEVLPEAVVGDEEKGYGLAYGNMAGLFVEALKEMKSQLDSALARLSALENTIS